MTAKKRYLGWLAGLWLAVAKPVRFCAKPIEFMRHSTQRLGFYFAEKWREVFRRRWIRPYSRAE